MIRTKELSPEQREKSRVYAEFIDAQVLRLHREYFNEEASILPFTHNLIETEEGCYYEFDPDKTDEFIDELMLILDEITTCECCEDCRISSNPKRATFYRDFFYLVIRLITLSLDGRDPELIVFREFFCYAKDTVTDLNKREFENRYALLKLCDRGVCQIPGMIGRLNDSLLAVDRNGFFLPNNADAVKASKAYVKEYESDFVEGEIEDIIADREMYISYLKSILEIEDDRFIDQDAYEMAIMRYYDGLFLYGNRVFEENVVNAVLIFLIRNGLTIAGAEEKYKAVFQRVEGAVRTIGRYNRENNKENNKEER